MSPLLTPAAAATPCRLTAAAPAAARRSAADARMRWREVRVDTRRDYVFRGPMGRMRPGAGRALGRNGERESGYAAPHARRHLELGGAPPPALLRAHAALPPPGS